VKEIAGLIPEAALHDVMSMPQAFLKPGAVRL
jgi:hypothetical protein